MDSNKYYTPETDDFFPGYEYEQKNPDGWTKYIYGGKDPALGWMLPCKMDGTTSLEFLRTPYLTKEDIMREGWTLIRNIDEEELAAQRIISDFKFFEVYYDAFLKELTVEEFNQTKLVNKPTGDYDSRSIFHGECKSINEFRKIMKWLKIKNPATKN